MSKSEKPQLTPISSFEAYDAMLAFKKTYSLEQIENVYVSVLAEELVTAGIFKDLFSLKMYLLQSLEIDFINGEADIPLNYYTKDEKIELKNTGIGMKASIDEPLDCSNVPDEAIKIQ